MSSQGYKCPGLLELHPILKIIDTYRDLHCQQTVLIPAQKKSKISKENNCKTITILRNENYCRTISILPNISKIYGRCLYDQIATYFENMFSKYQYDFHEGYCAQYCLLGMIEKMEKKCR